MSNIQEILKNEDRTYYFRSHRTCRTCFMNGKACIYQKEIEGEFKTIITKNDETKLNRAFMLMPFKEIIDSVYRTQFEPCLYFVCHDVIRADDVRKTGFVICEKICKQIQLASLIVAELTFDNANVFYELGLSYALNKNIAIFVQKDHLEDRKHILKKLGADKDHSRNTYDPFGEIKAEQIQLWHSGVSPKEIKYSSNELIDNIVTIILSDRDKVDEEIVQRKISYSIDKIAKGAVHRAIFNFNKRPSVHEKIIAETINVLDDTYELDKKNDNEDKGGAVSFSEIEDKIRKSNCVVICTSQKELSSYFWLGFAHGLEKNVIPITADRNNSTDPLPFDVRALWHIYFDPKKSKILENQIENILEIIEQKGIENKYRRKFWNEFLGNVIASIFVGCVELTPKYKRHVVGEWDYRTVSELVGFLTSTKETMETVIQTPIFQASSKLKDLNEQSREKFRLSEIGRLKRLLFERNSIILGSADVNDMAEMALSTNGKILPFKPDEGNQAYFNGIVSYKDSKQPPFPTWSTYFRPVTTGDDKRGFMMFSHGSPVSKPGYRWSCDYRPFEKDVESQGSNDKPYIILYAHLAKFKLISDDGSNNHYVVLIQGISGPATLGLAQVLTGAKYKQFTIFSELDNEKKGVETKTSELIEIFKTASQDSSSLKEFYKITDNGSKLPSMDEHAEKMTKALCDIFAKNGSVEAIIQVLVRKSHDTTHDERKILWWDFAYGPTEMTVPKNIEQNQLTS